MRRTIKITTYDLDSDSVLYETNRGIHYDQNRNFIIMGQDSAPVSMKILGNDHNVIHTIMGIRDSEHSATERYFNTINFIKLDSALSVYELNHENHLQFLQFEVSDDIVSMDSCIDIVSEEAQNSNYGLFVSGIRSKFNQRGKVLQNNLQEDMSIGLPRYITFIDSN